METQQLCLKNFFNPEILFESTDFLVVYKPPKMHSVPGQGESLSEWCGRFFPDVLETGRENRKGEGGILHRLDFETNGLVLFARNKKSFEALLEEQARGEMNKTYSAVVAAKSETQKKGFPPFAEKFFPAKGIFPAEIKSAFRPFGPKGREVRPLDGEGKIYTTEILDCKKLPHEKYEIRARINLGFRHQIRCHFAWAGFPIINDPLYSREKTDGVLALRCAGLCFTEPATGKRMNFFVPGIELTDIGQGKEYGNTNT